MIQVQHQIAAAGKDMIVPAQIAVRGCPLLKVQHPFGRIGYNHRATRNAGSFGGSKQMPDILFAVRRTIACVPHQISNVCHSLAKTHHGDNFRNMRPAVHMSILLLAFLTLADPLDEAKSALGSGEYDTARELLADAQSAAALSLRAELKLATGDYVGALADAQSAEAGLLVARARMRVGHYKEALGGLRAHIKTEDSPQARMLISELAGILGERDEVKRQANYFFDLYGSTREPSAATLTAIAFGVQHEDTHGAWRAYKEAHDADPDYLDAYLRAGFLCFDTYSWANGRAEFQAVLERNENHADAHAGLAAILFADDSTDGALQHAEAALAINPKQDLALELKSQILILEEKYEESLALLEQVLTSNPQDLEALALVAAHHDGWGTDADRDAAIAKIKAINPQATEFYNILALSAERRYQFVESTAWGKKAIETDPDDWQGYYMAGVGLLRLGEEREGYDLLDQAFSMNGFNIWAYNMLLVLDKDLKKKEYEEHQTEHFVVKMDRKDSKVFWPYFEKVLESAWDRYTKKYGMEPLGPKAYKGKILVLVLPNHQLFSARTVGLPGLGAAGVCFGQVILMPSPRAAGFGMSAFNWQAVIDHEFVHVMTLQRTDYRIPRWFTEGISTIEEPTPDTGSDSLFVWAVANNKLADIEDLNTGFTRPRFPQQFALSYAYSGLICEYLREVHGQETLDRMLTLYQAGKRTPEVVTEATGMSLEAFNAAAKSFAAKRVETIALYPPVNAETFEALQEIAEDDRTAQQWLSLSRGMLEDGEPAAAKRAAEKALEKDAKSARALNMLGQITYSVDDDAESAKAHFKNSLKIQNTFAANIYLGMILKDEESYEEAITHLEAARKLYPRAVNVPNVYELLTELYAETKQAAKGLAVAREAMKLEPTQKKLAMAAGQMAMDLNKPEAALECYQYAIRVNPFDEDLHLAALAAHKALKDNAGIEREARVTLGLAPRSEEALAALCEVLLDTDQLSEARPFIARLRRANRNHPLVERYQSSNK
jgi:tetratricopeptide (TPR) repeat protein